MGMPVRKAIPPMALAGRIDQIGIDSAEAPVYFNYA